jgi:hypothetical protein
MDRRSAGSIFCAVNAATHGEESRSSATTASPKQVLKTGRPREERRRGRSATVATAPKEGRQPHLHPAPRTSWPAAPREEHRPAPTLAVVDAGHVLFSVFCVPTPYRKDDIQEMAVAVERHQARNACVASTRRQTLVDVHWRRCPQTPYEWPGFGSGRRRRRVTRLLRHYAPNAGEACDMGERLYPLLRSGRALRGCTCVMHAQLACMCTCSMQQGSTSNQGGRLYAQDQMHLPRRPHSSLLQATATPTTPP